MTADRRPSFPIDEVRRRFPSLQRRKGDRAVTYLDAPGGTQVCQNAIDHTLRYLTGGVANVGGAFAASVETDAICAAARTGMADLLGRGAGEISFGPNMTTLTLGVAHALARDWDAGDEIVVTRLDHDANIAPWLQVARNRGMTHRWLDFDPRDGSLRLDELPGLLGPRTRLVAVTAASNALGSVTPLDEVCRAVRGCSRALIFVDAVQSVPHMPTDVAALDCDFLAFSLYKLFGPHQAALWTRPAVLEWIEAYKVRPASNEGGKRFETGAQSFEAQAAVVGVVEHLEWLGSVVDPAATTTRARLTAAMRAGERHEQDLLARLLDGLRSLPGVRIIGRDGGAPGVPLVAFTLDGWRPADVGTALARAQVNAWTGHFYAIEAIERLGLTEAGGVVRLGLSQYNTAEEVHRCLSVLAELK